MTEAQTYSWIFYAAAIACHKEPVNTKHLESVADAINHAVPTQKEISSSISWLIAQSFIERKGKKISLTKEGAALFLGLSKPSKSTMKTWETLTRAFEKMGIDNCIPLNCRTMRAEVRA